MRKLIMVAALLASASAIAQTTPGTCPNNSTTCSITTQTMGDSVTTAQGTNTKSDAAQVGNSANSITAGGNISSDQKAQLTQNADGNHLSSDARGNTSTNDNRTNANNSMAQANTGTVGNTTATTGSSSASNGPQTMGSNTNGANTNGSMTNGFTGSTGASSASTGASTSSSGPSSASTGASTSSVGAIGGNDQRTEVANGSESKSGAYSGGNALTGGASTSGSESSSQGGNSANSGGNSAVTVDAANRSQTKIDARVLYIPSVVPDTPPVGLAGANIAQQTFVCGPRQAIVRTPVRGAYIGFFTTSQIDQGFTEELVDAVTPFIRTPTPDGGFMLLGHSLVISDAVVGLGGARNLALGGGSGGSWGQGGGGASSSAQRMVKTITLRTCVYKEYRPVPVAPKPVPIEGELG